MTVVFPLKSDIYFRILLIILISRLTTSCPKPCECLGNVISCENQDVRKIPWTKFPQWVNSISLRQIRGFRHLSTSAVQSLTRLDGLKHLNITSCNEKLVFDGNWLRYLPSLEVLKISHCQLEKTPVFKPPHRNLKALILNRNNIEALNAGTFQSLPNLTRLEVNFNYLKKLKREWFLKDHPLQVLSANGNEINHLDPLLNITLNGLKELRLNRNHLCSISARSDPKSPSLSVKESHTGKFPLESGNDGMKGTSSKERIMDSYKYPSASLPLTSGNRRKRRSSHDCSNMADNILPSMPTVHTLELSRNRISKISTLTFKLWKSLKILRLKRNIIQETSLEAGAFFIQNGGLTTLDLTANKKLNQLKKTWLYMDDLRELIVSKCGLSHSIHLDAFSYTPKLSRLDLSGNKIAELKSGQFARLKGLQDLNLAGNLIKVLPAGVFDNLKKLHKMSLAGNLINSLKPQETSSYLQAAIMTIPKSVFVSLSNLVELDLSGNRLLRLERNNLAGLESLKVLNLRRNNLTRIVPPKHHCPQLTKLLLDSPRLTCDCSAAPLLRWLRRQFTPEASILITANCSSPVSLAGKALMSLRPSQFGSCEPQATLEPRVIFTGNTTMSLLRGGNVTLRCEVAVAGIPTSWTKKQKLALRPQVVWKRNLDGIDQEIRHSEYLPNQEVHFRLVDLIAIQSNVSHESSGKDITQAQWLSILIISSNSNGNLGAFQCFAKNNHGDDKSPKVQVNVYEFPEWTETPLNPISVVAGSVVTIPCAAKGYPVPSSALRKAGGIEFPAARERRLSFFSSDISFVIANVKRADAGEYLCESSNAAGKISMKFELVVNEIPSFIKSPQSKMTLTLGQTGLISCEARGWPFPDIRWTKNGKPLELHRSGAGSPVGDDSNNKTDTYAANIKSIQKGVSEPVVNAGPTPNPYHQTISSGSSKKKDNMKLTAHNQYLMFYVVSPEDAAVYRCTLWNAVGKTEATIVVDVRTENGFVYRGRKPRTTDPSSGRHFTRQLTGIVIIAVVICVVVTSLAWVAALYCFRWRKRAAAKAAAAAAAAAASAANGSCSGSSTVFGGRRPLLARSPSSVSSGHGGDIFVTTNAGFGSFNCLHQSRPGYSIAPNVGFHRRPYVLDVEETDDDDMSAASAAAARLLEKHRLLRRDATRVYDGVLSTSGVEEYGDDEDAQVVEHRVERLSSAEDNAVQPDTEDGAPTSDYNTGTSSECSANSLCVPAGATGFSSSLSNRGQVPLTAMTASASTPICKERLLTSNSCPGHERLNPKSKVTSQVGGEHHILFSPYTSAAPMSASSPLLHHHRPRHKQQHSQINCLPQPLYLLHPNSQLQYQPLPVDADVHQTNMRPELLTQSHGHHSFRCPPNSDTPTTAVFTYLPIHSNSPIDHVSTDFISMSTFGTPKEVDDYV